MYMISSGYVSDCTDTIKWERDQYNNIRTNYYDVHGYTVVYDDLVIIQINTPQHIFQFTLLQLHLLQIMIG